MLVVLVALLVIGPKDLPRVLRVVGKWVGKARGVAAHFRSGFDEMVRQSELEELEKKWKTENERIMREHPADPPADHQSDPRAEVVNADMSAGMPPQTAADVPAQSATDVVPSQPELPIDSPPAVVTPKT